MIQDIDDMKQHDLLGINFFVTISAHIDAIQ